MFDFPDIWDRLCMYDCVCLVYSYLINKHVLLQCILPNLRIMEDVAGDFCGVCLNELSGSLITQIITACLIF